LTSGSTDRTRPGRVAGKVALVTGAASGQGAAHARLLAQEGASVVCLDVASEAGEQVAAGILRDGGSAEFRRLDVGSLAEWEAVVSEAVARWKRIDVLVNNAGVIRTEGFIDETEKGWAEVIRVDQFGIFCGMKTVLPVMVAQRAGSIINISSNMGIAAIPDYAAYHAAKGAVVMMTKSAAVTYGPLGIRVNTICPGMVWTPMSEGHESNEPIIELTPLRRGATPEEISPGVLFLASDESRFVTGTELIMDGGYLAL
jgi:NAD(P)-dependent dehydrogenase (short-subunit alcohol dehydrogenase family)